MRFFNTAGPVVCKDHYCLPPLLRFNLEEILELIKQKKYFVLHAPRQTGKTTCLLALRDLLNKENNYYCLYINVEAAQAFKNDPIIGLNIILDEIKNRSNDAFSPDFLSEEIIEQIKKRSHGNLLNNLFSTWCDSLDKSLILLIDEVDSLIGDTLISILRQIRGGYDKRPEHFPSSIILCGVRDVRDYRIHSSTDKAIITGGSAFNIKAESLRLGDFSKEEMITLLLQHTEETGQIFEPEAIDMIYTQTEGQPWLVNALAYEICFKMPEGKNRENNITTDFVDIAKERLIHRRDSHIDQLIDKLREPRVIRVIEPILSGKQETVDVLDDDIMYLRDLGLISPTAPARIANPIYKEVIPRALTFGAQNMLVQEQAWYVSADKRLDNDKLLSAFQQYFRENSEFWTQRYIYKEAGPQLLLQAYLQRIVNGGGKIEREYGLGRGRTDLYICWPLPGGDFQRIVIECKILRGNRETVIEKGIEQTLEYADRCSADNINLIIFDTTSKDWEEKIYMEERGKVKVWGM